MLDDGRGTSPQVLNLTAALVWTYCDGRRDPDAIARAVARENPYAADRSTVHNLLAEFAKQGILD